MRPTTGAPSTGYNAMSSNDSQVNPGERGYRRMKIAAMAGTLYRSGQQAVTGIREQYAQTRPGMEGSDGNSIPHIPRAFPHVDICVRGTEQMMLFPSYAKRHVQKDWSQVQMQTAQNPTAGLSEEDFWKQEWERSEDKKAIVDVDVRGWVYSPVTGPMTRRNRMLIGLARQLSGISAPKGGDSQGYDTPGSPPRTQQQIQEEMREQERIEKEARQIEQRGQQEKRAAYRGEYSESPEMGAVPSIQAPRRSDTSLSMPPSPRQSAYQYASGAAEMTETELVAANANLLARVASFMTNPQVSLPITVFLYNDSKSQSRTIMTNEAGHFALRAPLDFVPTHFRVLANEHLAGIQEVKMIEPEGITLISDVDDTIKVSNISGGAREIFRNAFVRDLSELTIDGVVDWYQEMETLGVKFHYCSNSPWQLYPVLATFFKLTGLPAGSLHLKQYAGMLQGIFEPVAERKKSTLERLMRDFPHRKFLLVGDSGEADLEVYTELALANPGKILGIFIRDVTTPETTEFFETSFGPIEGRMSDLTLSNGPSAPQKPQATTRQDTRPTPTPSHKGPVMGDLIDFSESPTPSKPVQKGNASEMLAARKAPPPRPAKPASLRSTPSQVGLNDNAASRNSGIQSRNSPAEEQPPPLPTRKPVGGSQHPLATTQNSSANRVVQAKDTRTGKSRATDQLPPPPPPPRRRGGTPSSFKSLSPRLSFPRSTSNNSDVDFEPLPPPTQSYFTSFSRSATRSPTTSPPGSPSLGPQSALNRKVDMWNRRLIRANEQLSQVGVQLYTWRKGQDVVEEAAGLVKKAKEDMERRTRAPT